jgi:GrpB-like predicted nucleotidyltransferase (UPF0157 family)
MQIDPFDESLIHRKILSHNPAYRDMFRRVQEHVQRNLKTVELIHIGSTAISDLRGKPMVDITAVTNRADLRRTAGISKNRIPPQECMGSTTNLCLRVGDAQRAGLQHMSGTRLNDERGK